MKAITLPEWAKLRDESGKACAIVEVDTDAAYLDWLKLLGVDFGDLDQYWIEVAYQCIKMDVQAALEATILDSGVHAQINFARAERWALKNYKTGKGAAAATRGREARDQYKRIRGRVPLSG